MASPKHRVSRIVFHIIVSIITNACLLGFSIALLLPTMLLNSVGFAILTIVLVIHGLIRAVIAGYFARWYTISETLKIIGRAHGYLAGAFTGFMLGSRFGQIAGAFIGGSLFFFAGRWVGSRLSVGIGTYLTRFVIMEPPEDHSPVKAVPVGPRVAGVAVYLIPVLLTVLMLLFTNLGIQFDPFPKAVAVLRIVFSILTLVVVSAPWFLKPKWIAGLQAGKRPALWNPGFTVFYLGMMFSIVPAVYGFMLFAIGGSLIESLIYPVVSIVAATAWLIRERNVFIPAG